jgi:hypothetical protein
LATGNRNGLDYVRFAIDCRSLIVLSSANPYVSVVSCRHRLPTPFFQDGVKLLLCIVLRYNMKMQIWAVIANPVSGFRIKISRVEMKESSKWEDPGLYA